MNPRVMALKAYAKNHSVKDTSLLVKKLFCTDKDWEESEHPRDKDGKFSSSNNSGCGSESKSSGKSSTHYSETKTMKNYDTFLPQYLEDYEYMLEETENGYSGAPEQAEAIRTFKKNIPKYESTLKQAFETYDFSSRTDADAVIGILSDGRMKTQIETGTSHGYLDKQKRIHASENMFNGGDPMDIGDDEYEVYGYLGTASRADMYGDCRIIFKKDNISDRTTFTIGDSLEQDASGAWQIPTLVKKPQIVSYNMHPFESDYYLPTETLSHVDTMFDSIRDSGQVNSSGEYVELQIHGGVKLQDIEYIEVPASHSKRDKIEALATKNGVKIKWM